jgi:outer membrane immunogenic protein
MKNLILILFLSTITSSLLAQGPIAKGQTQMNMGFGFSTWGLPLYMGFDHGVHKDVTVGAEVSFRAFRERLNRVYYHHTVVGFSGNGNYHFNSLLGIPNNWDLYAGLNIGFFIWDSPKVYPGTYTSGLGLGLQIGGRHYFTNKFGINLEVGGGNRLSSGKFGISIRF